MSVEITLHDIKVHPVVFLHLHWGSTPQWRRRLCKRLLQFLQWLTPQIARACGATIIREERDVIHE